MSESEGEDKLYVEMMKKIKRVCKNCKSTNRFEDRWCSKCGARIASNAELLYIRESYDIIREFDMYG